MESCLFSILKEIKPLSRYLMVDAVVNDVMALTTTPDYSTSQYLFKNAVRVCRIDQRGGR